MTTRGRGTIHTRRNLAESTDPYLNQFEPREVAVCTECHAIYQRRHWFFDDTAYARETENPGTHKVSCPACQKIRDRYAEGRLTLEAGAFLRKHKNEILHLIRNEEDQAKGLNPLGRIIEITEEKGTITVTTTNEKLAQRIGRLLRNAYQGKTTYHWSEPKFLSVVWHRE